MRGVSNHRTLPAAALGLALFITALPVLAQDTLNESVRLVGRFHVEPGRITAEWPGSLIEIRFEGARLDVAIHDAGENNLLVEVDGKLERLETQPGTHTYTVVNDDKPSTHVVRLIRRTEAAFGRTELTAIVTDGRLLPPRGERRRLLVVGDSISAGYGVEGLSPDCGFDADLQNQYLTFGAVAARNLDADIITLAVSGAGLVRNYDGSTQRTMAELVYRLLPSASTATPLPPADVVVIHLGTNDFADGSRPADFTDAYEALLGEIRATSPTAMIYAAMGPMLRPDDQNAAVVAIEAAVEARRRADDEQIVPIRFGWELKPEDLGCDWHPSAVAQAHMAAELEWRIRDDIGWEDPS
ncbi:hypothetical protein FHG66_19935 [Rubellimicrobium rubrum]|uniref:SGNH hydrolase-type esterase domain-containing protein n=1 Tax=Rubellimicrobium rubrum TaxID=2585369 RepID=A0A5C4MQD7_9RHOB|nr:SGNH/GDSL hydrolase family protein [Rubellimicrobium rubrum]TNC45944.1 hypothetical protein FHG66_19935 [Rubellimicrobium rubrum]